MKRRMIDPDLLREKLEQRKLSTGKLIQVAYCMDEATVEVELVRHGRWIDECCSECGQYVYRGDARNYCPNCGAKMDAERPECGKDVCEI